MFYCQVTGLLSKPGEKLNRLVVKTRDKQYSWKDEEGAVHTSSGFEIVKEVNASEQGVAEWNSWSASERANFGTNV